MLRQLGRRISICVLASLIAVTCTDGPLIRDCAKELSFKSLDLCINELCTTGAIVSGVSLIDLEYRRSDAGVSEMSHLTPASRLENSSGST